jgi:hypothetical protein
LQRTQVDAYQFRELALADLGRLANSAHVRLGQSGRSYATHTLARHVALHFAHAFDELLEMLLILV